MKKISNLRAVFLYLIPTALSIAAVYLIMPLLRNSGWSVLAYYSAAMLIPFGIQLILAISLSEAPKLKSLNLKKLQMKDWGWIICAVLFMFITSGLLDFTAKILAESVFTPPSWWPASTDPRLPKDTATFFGQTLAGNWGLWITATGLTIFGGLSEELFGRGYILMRQSGKYAWVLNGLLWTLSHTYTPWNYIALLPGSLALAYVTQKKQNTTVALAIHFIVQLIPSVIMLFFM
ncbi:MAG TPA: CPBP family intramembrane glutamic endopeptidase [Clostridia bacterium]|nr:CPBP family intramembrane glutamic endopeptidase [Clostridia bacterium]